MSLFIQVEQSLFTHRKTLRLARLPSLDRCAVIGRLVALWLWCLDNALGGRLSDDIDADMLVDVMCFDAAPGKPADLLEALLAAGFLALDADGQMRLVSWERLEGHDYSCDVYADDEDDCADDDAGDKRERSVGV